MKKIIKRCVTKAEADKLKEKAIKMGFRASTFQTWQNKDFSLQVNKVSSLQRKYLKWQSNKERR